MDSDKKITHVRARKAEAIRCKQRVMNLLGWSELRYCTFQYEEGLRYLSVYLKGDQYTVAIMERSAVFWGWWKNRWIIREVAYLLYSQSLKPLSLRLREEAYKGLHDPHMLAAEESPISQGMGDSYMNMMEMLMNEEKRTEKRLTKANK